MPSDCSSGSGGGCSRPTVATRRMRFSLSLRTASHLFAVMIFGLALAIDSTADAGVILYFEPTTAQQGAFLSQVPPEWGAAVAASLPDALSGFDSIWWIGTRNGTLPDAPLTSSERARLASYLANGGGVLLMGE